MSNKKERMSGTQNWSMFSSNLRPYWLRNAAMIYITYYWAREVGKTWQHFNNIPLTRDSSRDCCIKQFIKRIWSSGLFWEGGAAEKKTTPNCHKYATFLGVFFSNFCGQIFLKFFIEIFLRPHWKAKKHVKKFIRN